MAHTNRKLKVTDPRVKDFGVRNECGLVAFHTRNGAKAAINRMNRPGYRALRCESCGLFHIKKLPKPVRDGTMTHAEYFYY